MACDLFGRAFLLFMFWDTHAANSMKQYARKVALAVGPLGLAMLAATMFARDGLLALLAPVLLTSASLVLLMSLERSIRSTALMAAAMALASTALFAVQHALAYHAPWWFIGARACCAAAAAYLFYLAAALVRMWRAAASRR
jgi:hypothetical protein